MTTTYTWNVVKMDCYPEADGQPNVVFRVHWKIIGTDGNYDSSIYGSVGVRFDHDYPFTPYADLTKNQVIGWVQDALGAEQVAAYKSTVDRQIAAQVNPPVVTPPLPWIAQ